MGTKERKERERKQRKNQILNAAISLVEEQGFDKTTMDEIADRAELSKGTLYLYYNDKSSLYQAIKRRGLQHLHNKFHQIIQQDLPGAELVKEMNLKFLKIITQNAAFTRSMAIYEHLSGEKHLENAIVRECNAIEDEIFMLLVRAIQIGIQDGSITTSKPPKILALNISFQMSGLLKFYLSGSNQNIQNILKENELTIPKLLEEFLDIQLNTHTH